MRTKKEKIPLRKLVKEKPQNKKPNETIRRIKTDEHRNVKWVSKKDKNFRYPLKKCHFICYTPLRSNGGVYSSFALLFSCMYPCTNPRSIAVSRTF